MILASCLFVGSECEAPCHFLMHPWEYLVRSPWPLFELMALWSKRTAPPEHLPGLDCDADAEGILDHIPWGVGPR